MTLRARLLIGFGLVLAALATSMVVVAATQRGYAQDQLDRQLESALPFALLPPRTGPLEGPTTLPEGPTTPPDNSTFQARTSDFFVGSVSEEGELTTVIRGDLLDDVPAIDADDLESLDGDGGNLTVDGEEGTTRFRVRAASLPDGSWAVVALALDEADAANRALLTALGVAGLVIIAVLCLTGWWMYRLGLRPIAEVTTAAERIAAGDQEHRVDPEMPGLEAQQLARAFNVMLDERDAQEQTLRRFVADASHELRTPLTSVRGYLEVYADGGFRGHGEVDDVVRRLLGETKRMNDLVEDLLLLANLDEGRPLARDRIDLADVVRDAADDGRAIQPERPITTSVGGADLHVVGDEARLRQVVAALVHNALVHTPVTADIRLEGDRRDDVVTIAVIDRGPGMSPEVAERAFDRFTRGDPSRSRHAGGAGLGLPIAKSIVEAHGGSIDIETAPSEGTAFRIRLPVGQRDKEL